MPAPLHQVIVVLVLLATLVGGGCARRGAHADYSTGLQYTVQPGDTLLAISARYDVDITDIVRANHLRDRQLSAGQQLLLPGVSPFVDVTPAKPVDEPLAEPTLATTDWYTPRSAWAVQSIDASNIDPMTHIYRLTVHHSGEEGDVIDDPVEAMRHFEAIHKRPHGTNPAWACIGYHFVISRDGRVFEGRPLKYQGAHAQGDNNIGNIGVCLIGDFEREPVPAAQRAAMVAVLDRLTEQYGIARDQVFGHREFKATDCPGRYLMAVVEQYRGSGTGAVGPADPWVAGGAKKSASKAPMRSSHSKKQTAH